MNRKAFNKICEDFNKSEARLKSLKVGDSIYELEAQDPDQSSFFEHKVVSVDLEEMIVNTLDLSQKISFKEGKPSIMKHFYLPEEAFPNKSNNKSNIK